MKRLTGWLWLCGWLGLFPGMTTLGLAAQPIDQLSVPLIWKHQFEFAAFYVAMEQGYYTAAGLEVRILEGCPGIDAVKEVVTGRAESGVGISALVVERARGVSVVALATLMQHSSIGLLALRRNGVDSVHHLADKPVAVEPHSRDEIEAYLCASGIPAAHIRFVNQADWTLDSPPDLRTGVGEDHLCL